MKRQINISLFERLLLSNDEANKKKVLELALKGNEIAKLQDIVKDPYVFEFLGLLENKPMMESDLEKALSDKLIFIGIRKRIYVCRNSTKSNIR